MLQKISDNNNVLTWFEIPVLDTTRAKKFYETIFDIVMTTKTFTETNEELTFFPTIPMLNKHCQGELPVFYRNQKTEHQTEKGIFIYI